MASLIHLIPSSSSIEAALATLSSELTRTPQIKHKSTRMIAQSLIHQAQTALQNTFTTIPPNGIVLYLKNDGTHPYCEEASTPCPSMYVYGSENPENIVGQYLSA